DRLVPGEVLLHRWRLLGALDARAALVVEADGRSAGRAGDDAGVRRERVLADLGRDLGAAARTGDDGHHAAAAICSARCVSTRTALRLYSTVPRWSSCGSAASAASRAASANASAPGCAPASACSASEARR